MTSGSGPCCVSAASRGFYTHQAAAIEHALNRRNVVITTPTASGKTLCYNAPVLSACCAIHRRRALVSVPDQGARAGSVGGAACACRISSPAATISRSVCSPTTGIRRRMPGAPSGDARTSCSATPTWCTRESFRIILDGRSCSRICSSSSSTSCTRIAACSAAI